MLKNKNNYFSLCSEVQFYQNHFIVRYLTNSLDYLFKNKPLYLTLVFGLFIVLSNTFNSHNSALAAKSKVDFTKEKSSCANQDLEKLTNKMLRDLPAYFNRATQRARRLDRSVEVYSYMLVAGKPDFQPLPLRSWGDVATDGGGGVKQVFFTTLERQYLKGKAVQLQGFHWLFLTKTQSGWRVAMLYSQIGGYPKRKPPTPPRESSNSAVGQGIKTWLRDCRAETVRF